MVFNLIFSLKCFFFYTPKTLSGHYIICYPAVRAVTFGSWRMLTQGAEYEDTWAPSHDAKRGLSKAPDEEDPDPAEDGPDHPQEPRWSAVHGVPQQKYDAVLQLDGVSGAAGRDGVRRAVWRHDTLNQSPLTHRSDRLLKSPHLIKYTGSSKFYI